MKFSSNAGSYRHPITFQRQTSSTNEYGEKIISWTDIVTTRAGIYPISGKDYISAVESNSEITHKVNLRYVPNITADMRIQFGTRFFTIVAILNFQEKNRELQIVAKEFL